MAEIVRYVDPDAAGLGDGTSWANAYNSLFDWEAGQQQDLTDGAGDNMVCYCRSLSGGDDTEGDVIINGWTTGAAQDIKIIGESGYRAVADGWDDAGYVLDAEGANGIDIAEDYVTIDGLQITVSTNTATRYIVAVEAQGANNLVIIKNCRLRGNSSTTVALRGIYSIDANTITRIYNTIIERTGTQARAVTNTAGTMNVFNCLAYGAYAGFYEAGGTMNIYNSVSLNNDDDFEGSPTVISYCASDDNDTTDATNVAEDGGGADWTGDFTDGSAGDWTLLSTSNLVGATADRSGGLFTTDIDGTTRGSTWDVGPHEYVAAGGSEVLTGSITGVSSLNPMIWRTRYPVAAPAGVSDSDGDIWLTIYERGAPAGTSDSDGDIWLTIYERGAPTGTSDSDGFLRRNLFESAAPAGVSDSDGTLWRRIFHSVAVTGVSTVWGNLATELIEALAGAIEGISAIAGMISRSIYPSGGPVGNSGPTGDFFRDLFFVTVPAAISDLFGNISLSGSSTASRLRIYMKAHKPRRR